MDNFKGASLRLFDTLVLLFKSLKTLNLLALLRDQSILEHRSVLTQWDGPCFPDQVDHINQTNQVIGKGIKHV
jgi:hypothetical protein